MVSHSRSKIRIPSLRRHKASGQAVVTIRGRDIYCGKFGSVESDQHYRRVIAELLANGAEVVRHHGAARNVGRGRRPSAPTTSLLTVAELVLAYVEFAEGHYLPPSREIEPIKVICRTIRELFGTTLAADFGPRSLKTLRQHWIDQGLARVKDRSANGTSANDGRAVRIMRSSRWS